MHAGPFFVRRPLPVGASLYAYIYTGYHNYMRTYVIHIHEIDVRVHVHTSEQLLSSFLTMARSLENVLSSIPDANNRSLENVLSSVPDANRWKLDREIDFEHRDVRGEVIPHHLGRIANSMTNWEGVIADLLGLSETDRSDIREKCPSKPQLQR